MARNAQIRKILDPCPAYVRALSHAWGKPAWQRVTSVQD